MRRPLLVAIFAGGALGALARAALVEAAPAAPGTWPWVTFAVNLAGAFLLGMVAPSDRLRPLVGTGFCGALTTFSTMQLELVRMTPGLAVAYAAASLAGGLLAASAGLRVAGA